MNVICLIGRICGEPELKTTQNGVSVVSFSLAVDRSYTPKGQEKQTDFINCVAWRNTAEFVSKYFHKGQRMGVKGELQQSNYTANDGSKRTDYKVVVDGAFFCEARQPIDSFLLTAKEQGVEYEEVVTDDDIPF